MTWGAPFLNTSSMTHALRYITKILILVAEECCCQA